MGEVGKRRERGERDGVEKTGGMEERRRGEGKGTSKGKYFLSPPPIFFFN